MKLVVLLVALYLLAGVIYWRCMEKWASHKTGYWDLKEEFTTRNIEWIWALLNIAFWPGEAFMAYMEAYLFDYPGYY